MELAIQPVTIGVLDAAQRRPVLIEFPTTSHRGLIGYVKNAFEGGSESLSSYDASQEGSMALYASCALGTLIRK